MARLNKGFVNGFTGVIGNLEGYMLNGQLILRTRRTKSSRPPTEKQLASYQKMRVVNKFLGAFIEFERTGFTYVTKGKTYSAHNAATSWQLKNAIAGEYPDFTINYAAARVTEGPMDTHGINPSATIKDNKLIFIWTPNFSYAHSNDNAMLLAYAPALNEAVYKISGAKRDTGMDELNLFANGWKTGVEIHIYLSFITEDRTRCTNSMYLGRFIM
jgi:hypothetical protein